MRTGLEDSRSSHAQREWKINSRIKGLCKILLIGQRFHFRTVHGTFASLDKIADWFAAFG